MAVLEFFFDVGSPASYLAWTQLPGLARDTGAECRLRPMLLGGVFQATGNASPASVPAKGAYMAQDLALALGLVLVWMWHDARARGRRFVPWLLLTLVAGSFGPLLYLLAQRREPPR